jgi:hypothetical protein
MHLASRQMIGSGSESRDWASAAADMDIKGDAISPRFATGQNLTRFYHTAHMWAVQPVTSSFQSSRWFIHSVASSPDRVATLLSLLSSVLHSFQLPHPTRQARPPLRFEKRANCDGRNVGASQGNNSYAVHGSE